MLKKTGIVISILSILILSFISIPAESKNKDSALGPYDTMRDYIDALEERGRLLHIDKIDQDKYEGTAFVYKMIDKLGIDKSPAVSFENIKINGKWMKGPVLANIFPGWDASAMVFGAKKINNNPGDMYRAARSALVDPVEKNGDKWKRIKPVVLNKKNVPCKEVIIKGDDVDIYKYPWFKNNPGDAAQYINTGAVFMEDPKVGRNVGTYRIQVKGKNKVGMNTERGQHGWQIIMGAKRRGKKSIPAAIALGVDPVTFSMSCTKVAQFGEDELEFAGGILGKPIELVKCETSDILVPANAEMIIEGEVIIELEDEGPYGEMYGYMGHQHKNFYMNVTAITHRKNPIFINNFTGVTNPTNMIPWSIGTYIRLKKLIPGLVELYNPREATGMTVISINKRFPAQGIAAGQAVLVASSSKIVVVVDKDVDITNMDQVLHAIATRWQPSPGSLIIPQTFSYGLDPSMLQRGVTSKIIIDATQRGELEGGPKAWQPVSRVILEKEAPESFETVEKNWDKYWKGWKN